MSQKDFTGLDYSESHRKALVSKVEDNATIASAVLRRAEQFVKIAHIATFDRSMRNLLLGQLLSIQRAGYEVVGISTPGPDVPVIEAAGIRHIPVHMTRRITPFADLVSLWRLYRVIRQERFTIVHTHTPKAGVLGQLAAYLAGVPVVIRSVHGFQIHDHMHPVRRRLYISMEKIAARCSDIILSQNREDIRIAIERGICSSEKIKHLGNGIDLTYFDPNQISSIDIQKRRTELGIPRATQIVGFVGRLTAKRKGFLDFLAASRQVVRRSPNVRYLIIGETDFERPDAVSPAVASQYGIEEKCIFVGRRPNEELPLLYAQMDILVLPSLFEGIPRVVMEASAMRTPIVATNVKGNREAVIHDRNGLLIPLGDVQALADAIIAVLTDRQKALNLGAEGHRMAQELFDENLVFDKVKAEYARLLRQKDLAVPESHSIPISVGR